MNALDQWPVWAVFFLVFCLTIAAVLWACGRTPRDDQ